MAKVQAPLRFKKGDKVSVCLCGSIWYNGIITNAEIKRGLKPYTIEDEDGGVGIDFDLMEYKDIEFMGMPVTDVKIFKTHLSGLGVNFNEMLDEECVGLFSNKDIEKLKNMF